MLGARAGIALHGVWGGEVVPGTIKAHRPRGRRNTAVAQFSKIQRRRKTSTYTRKVMSVVGAISQFPPDHTVIAGVRRV